MYTYFLYMVEVGKEDGMLLSSGEEVCLGNIFCHPTVSPSLFSRAPFLHLPPFLLEPGIMIALL